MEVIATTKAGKKLFHLKALDAFSLAVLIMILIWMVSEFMQGRSPLEEFIDNFRKLPKEAEVDIIPLLLVKATMFLLFLFSSVRLIYSVFFRWGFGYLKHIIWDRNIKILVPRKILSELGGSHLYDHSYFEKERKLALADEKKLIEAVGNRIVNSTDIYPSDWDLSSSNIRGVLDNIKAPLSGDEEVFLKNREKCKSELTNLCSSTGDGISLHFLTASVQPSILLAIKKLIQECKLSDEVFHLHADVSSGPETVNEARKSIINDEKREKRITIFAAPLSAFVMAKSISEGDAPSAFFYPICSLIDEEQKILVLEDGKRTPVRAGSIHYYDNSTAEEYVISNNLNMLHAEVNPIDDYSSYKSLLHSGSSGDIEIMPGDGIVVWPPLTDYYNSHGIPNGYFVVDGIEKVMPTRSRIMLYCDKSSLDIEDDKHRLAIAFICALLLELRFTKTQMSGRRKIIRALKYERNYLKSYRPGFLRLVRPDQNT